MPPCEPEFMRSNGTTLRSFNIAERAQFKTLHDWSDAVQPFSAPELSGRMTGPLFWPVLSRCLRWVKAVHSVAVHHGGEPTAWAPPPQVHSAVP